MIPLSVLDLSPVTTATPGSAALHNSLDLARLAYRLGYKRYWVAEHHNLANIASSSPEIMIGQIAAITSHIRVGSGGVMLPNHAPLMVAERFKVLEALFPENVYDQTAQMSPIRHEKGRTGRPSGTANGHGLVIDQQSCPLYRPHGRGGSCWPGR